MKIPGLALQPNDGAIICFKVGWKFALFFDIGPDRSVDLDAMERSLGALYRYLSFEEVYAALGDPALVERLTRSGWFPFVEILGGEFEKLLKAHQLDFNVAGEEELLLKAFDAARIDTIAGRWWHHPRLTGHRAILEPALKAFKNGEPVASLKIILTEIEGIIQAAHIAEIGEGASINKLLKYAIEKGVKKNKRATHRCSSQSRSLNTCRTTRMRALTRRILRRMSCRGTASVTAVPMRRHTLSSGRFRPFLTLDQIAFYL